MFSVWSSVGLHVLHHPSEQKQLKGREEPRARPEQQGAAGSVLKGRLCLSTPVLPTDAVQCLHLSNLFPAA